MLSAKQMTSGVTFADESIMGQDVAFEGLCRDDDPLLRPRMTQETWNSLPNLHAVKIQES